MFTANTTSNTTASTISRMFESISSTNQSVVTNQMLTKAYGGFARRHPQPTIDLLDKHFLMGDGKPIIDDYVNGAIGRRNAAVALADARDEQLYPARHASRKQRKADLTLAADSFLKILRTELG